MTSQEVWLFATDSQMFKQNSEQFAMKQTLNYTEGNKFSDF